jgi:hypothetical protein
MRTPAFLGFLVFAAAGGGCDDKPLARERRPEAPTASVTAPPPRPPPDPLAGISVDELGIVLPAQRIDMTAKDVDTRVRAAVGELPLQHRAVTVSVTRSAKAEQVGILARALGEAGASAIDFKTPTRSGSDGVLKVTPPEIVGKSTPDCAVVSMVKKDNSCAVWRIKGGTASRFAKGLAGPDLSMTVEGTKKQMATCAATSWFVAGEEGVLWGLVFDLAQMGASANPPLKTTSTVFVPEAPIAGRPVQLARK